MMKKRIFSLAFFIVAFLGFLGLAIFYSRDSLFWTSNQDQENNTPSIQKEKQQGNSAIGYARKYPVTDGATYRISSLQHYDDCSNETWAVQDQEMLEIKIGDTWQEVYRVEARLPSDENCSEMFGISEKHLSLSPLRDYVEIHLFAWERGKSLLLNTQTKKVIVGTKINILPRSIWTEDGRNYCFLSFFSAFGGDGRDGVWVSQYNTPDAPVNIFDLEKWAQNDPEAPYKYTIKNLKFLDKKTIEFSVFSQSSHNSSMSSNPNEEELVRYNYDLERGKLSEVYTKK